MSNYVEVKVSGITYKITPEVAQKYGEAVPLTPADHQREVLVPVTDSEWNDFLSVASRVNGTPITAFSAMIRPIMDEFMAFRCGKLK